jgi:hypothetical protein
MIRPASDKSTGGRELATWARQCPSAVKKWNTQNKSVSRTRKEKCQTDRPRRPERSLPGRYEALVGRFFGPFAVILEEKGGPSYHSRLTFLTRRCQKCQTCFAKALNNRKKRRLSSETASPHNTTAPPTRWNGYTQSNHIPAAGARSPSAPVRASYQHISKPLHSSFPTFPSGSAPPV